MSHLIPRLAETAAPEAEPLALDDVKTFLRVDQDDEDDEISALIATAREVCESITGRSLISRGYSLYLDCWPEARDILLPQPPLISVAHIHVYAADNTSVTVATDDYYVDAIGAPGRIVLTEEALPPCPGRIANGIEVQFTAGYGAAPEDVPPMLRQGMKQIVAHLYEHRGDSPDQALVASGAAVLFQPYRLMSLS